MAETSHNFRNSKQTNIIIGLVGLVFIGACLAVAFAGKGSDTASETQLQTQAPVAADEPESATVPVVDEVVAAPDPVETDAAQAEAEPVVADEPESATVPVVAEAAPTAEPDSDAAPAGEQEDDATAEVATEEDLADAETADTEETDPESDSPDTDTSPKDEPAVTEPDPTPDVPRPDSPASPPGAPLNFVIVSNGEKLFLHGVVPSAEYESRVVGAFEAVFGTGNVISEYALDPDVPEAFDGPIPMYFEHDLSFASGSTAVPAGFYSHATSIPVLLDLQPDLVLTITGHTDSTGDVNSNQALSQGRVDALRDWLVSEGSDADRIIAVGKGDSDPRSDNATEAGRAENRRVEFLIEGFDIAS